MAQVDARLINVAFEDAKRFTIRKGEVVYLRLIRTPDDYDGPVETATIGDQILDVIDGQEPGIDEAEVTAKAVGESRFFFIQKNDDPESFNIIKQVRIKVVEEIESMATNLNLTGEPIDK